MDDESTRRVSIVHTASPIGVCKTFDLDVAVAARKLDQRSDEESVVLYASEVSHQMLQLVK